MVELKKKNWRDYLKSNNPVAAALLSKMGYSETERIEVKKEFLRMLVRMKLDPAHEFTKLPNSWENRGIKKGLKLGIEKGVEKGVEKGREEVAFEMLKEGLSIELIAKVTHLDQEAIEELQKQLIK